MINFVGNTADRLHCTQASLIMLVQELTGELLSMDEAERATGFRPDVETWPYGMIDWLARRGFEVEHVDALDAEEMAADPRAELVRSGLDASTIDYFFEISDFELEAQRIRSALDLGVTFRAEIPEVEELIPRMGAGWVPLLSLNARTLASGLVEEFDGHVVLATAVDGSGATIQDPGPPARENLLVPLDRLARALRSPVDASGTITFVRRRLAEGGGQDVDA